MSPVLEGQMMARLTRESYQREHPFRAWVERHTDVLVEMLTLTLVVSAYAAAVYVLGHIRL